MRPKFVIISFIEWTWFQSGEPLMRIAGLVIAGSLAAILASPQFALARSNSPPKTEQMQEPSTCSARQRGADGTWMDIPCQELGSSARPQPKPVMRNEDEEAH
jgi:hypothetical protein